MLGVLVMTVSHTCQKAAKYHSYSEFQTLNTDE